MARNNRPVQFNGNQYADRIDNVGGDQFNYNDSSGLFAFQALGGTAKFFAVLGLLIFFAGFLMFGFFVVAFMMTIISAMGSTEPPDMSSVASLAVPWLPLGIGLAVAGILIINIAVALGKPRYR
jgi:hypothetical protein